LTVLFAQDFLRLPTITLKPAELIRNAVRTAAQTIGGSARLTQPNRLSPCYLTKWKDLLMVQCGNPMDLWIPGRG